MGKGSHYDLGELLTSKIIELKVLPLDDDGAEVGGV